MKLIRTKNSNRYCGPGALALLTGVHVDDAARMLRLVSGRTAIRGTYPSYMVKALDKLGYSAEPVSVARNARKLRPTLTQVLAGVLRYRDWETMYLVVVGNHYVVIRGRRMWDNKNPDGVFLGECPYRRRRVSQIWTVRKVADVPLPPKPMTLAQFTAAVERLGLSTDGSYVDAPDGHRFQASALHGLAITGTYEEILAQLRDELPLEVCPQDCECREEVA